MASNFSDPSEGHAYIEAHAEFLRKTLYRVADAAIANALGYFHSEQVPVDAFLFPDITRFWMKRFFKEMDKTYHLVDLSNNGLRLDFADSSLRIWKSSDGSIANPFGTKTKRDYLTQPDISQCELIFDDLPSFSEARKLAGMALRLVVLWDKNEANEAELFLVCPKSIRRHPTRVNYHWKLPIPRGIAKTRPSDEPTVAHSNDLDLELESEKTGTEDDHD